MILSSISKLIGKMSTIKTKFIDYKAGGPENLFVSERELTPLPNHYLMKVNAVGINRAECLHRLGRYPINNDVEKNIGLEASGEIIDEETGKKLFDGIALLSGGSYSQYALIPKSHVMPLPESLSHTEGAAIPEAWITAFLLLRLADLKEGDTVVIYAGASGVGTAAIQICRILGYTPFAVVSGEEKGVVCKKYGTEGVVYYKGNEKWDEELLSLNGGKGFNAVLDCVGPGNADKTTKVLGVDGKWIFYGTLSGLKGEVNFGQMISKRINLISTTLKTRSKEYKDQLIQEFSQKILTQFEKGKALPVIGEVLSCDWESADSFIKAHQTMEGNLNSGKIVIEFKK